MIPSPLGAPLRAFVDALGGDHESWRSREQPNDITYADLQLPRERALALPFDVLRALTESYGDSLACTFHHEDELLLRVDQRIDSNALHHLANESRGLDTITLQFRLNKRRLVDQVFQVPEGCHAILYLYPDALEVLLQSPLAVIEDRLWGAEANHKVIIVLDERPIFLDGQMLAVVGGEHIDRVSRVSPPNPAAIEQFTIIHATAVEHLHWRQEWVHSLTPLHLDVQGIGDSSALGAKLRFQCARLLVLYTADKSIDANGNIVCTYSSPDASVDVVVPNGLGLASIPEEAAGGMRQVFNWIYENPSTTKRLSVAQLVFARHLHFVEPSVRFDHLLQILERARDELVWTEKAVMAETLRIYTADVRSLEDYVDKTVQVFAEQISAVVKSFTDMMLAGLGTVIVGALALLIKEGSGSMVLGVALFAYAFYVFVFQINYVLPNHKDREELLADDFQVRCDGFKQRIYDENVDRIIGDRLTKARAMFCKWMKRARAVSWVIVALFGLSGLILFAVGLGTNSGATNIVTPSATTTLTTPTVLPKHATATAVRPSTSPRP